MNSMGIEENIKKFLIQNAYLKKMNKDAAVFETTRFYNENVSRKPLYYVNESKSFDMSY